jgi:hypothetical protein
MNTPTIRAIVIQPGTSGCVDDVEDTLPAFRRFVGGHVEQVSSEDLRIGFWHNENGWDEGLSVNELATKLWWAKIPSMARRDLLFGTVIVALRSGPQTTSVPSSMVELWQRAVPAFLERQRQFEECEVQDGWQINIPMPGRGWDQHQ